jgi:hypothetical protein
MAIVNGILSGCLLVFGAITICLLYPFALPLYWINYPLFRLVTSRLAGIFFPYVALILEKLLHVEYYVTGDPFDGSATLLISNHRTRTGMCHHSCIYPRPMTYLNQDDIYSRRLADVVASLGELG